MLNFFTLLTQKHIPGLKKKHKGHKQYDLLVSVNTMLHISLNFPRILVLKHTSKTWKAWERDRGYSTFPSCRHIKINTPPEHRKPEQVFEICCQITTSSQMFTASQLIFRHQSNINRDFIGNNLPLQHFSHAKSSFVTFYKVKRSIIFRYIENICKHHPDLLFSSPCKLSWPLHSGCSHTLPSPLNRNSEKASAKSFVLFRWNGAKVKRWRLKHYCWCHLQLDHVAVGALVHHRLQLLVLHRPGQRHRLLGERLLNQLGEGWVLPDSGKITPERKFRTTTLTTRIAEFWWTRK